MPALTIVSVPVSVDVAHAHTRVEKDVRTSARGRQMPSRLADTFDMAFATKRPLIPSEGDALRRLIDGEGHVWKFADRNMASYTGISPSPGYRGLTNVTGGPFSDAGFHTVTSGTTTSFKCLPYLNKVSTVGPWTAIVTKFSTESSTWRKYAIRSDGVTYRDGVVWGVVPSWLTATSSGSAVLNHLINIIGVNDTGVANDARIAELVVLPWSAPAAWLALWTARTTRWPALPQLEVAGDVVQGQVTCIGRVASYAEVSCTLEGVHYNDAVTMAFALNEFAEQT